MPEVEPGLQHVNLSQRQLSDCFNWTLELFYIQECLFLIQTHFSNIQGQEIHFLQEKTTWIIRILWSNTLILETSLHTVYTMFDSPVVTWSHRHVQLYLYLYRLLLLFHIICCTSATIVWPTSAELTFVTSSNIYGLIPMIDFLRSHVFHHWEKHPWHIQTWRCGCSMFLHRVFFLL